MALVALHLCAQEREAWTDVGDIGVGRASDLTQSDKKRQILPTYAGTPPTLYRGARA